MESNPINKKKYIALSSGKKGSDVLLYVLYGHGLFNTVDGLEIPRPITWDGGKSPGMVVKPCR